MRLFPASNIWNVPVDALPVQSDSDSLITVINKGISQSDLDHSWLRCDDVMPINFTSGSQIRRPAGLWAEADSGTYATPLNALSEGMGNYTGDVHTLVVEDGMLYEFYTWNSTNVWENAMACKWDLNSHAMRPDGLTSCDAAGLPIAPGILRYEEILAGEVTHALRFTARRTHELYRWPARHFARVYDPNVPIETRPQMGQRVRLKASFDITPFSPAIQIILKGLKKYGAMLADNGMPWGMQHDQDSRWSGVPLAAELHQVWGTSMECVDATAFQVSTDLQVTGNISNCVMITDKLARPTILPLGSSLGVVGGKLEVIGGTLRANIAPLQQQVASNVATENAATERLGGN